MLGKNRYARGLIGGVAIAVALAAGAAAQVHAAPESAAAATTHRVLFDNTKAETAGNADWIISTSQPDPTAQNPSPTKETDWTGALSAGGWPPKKTGSSKLDTLPAGSTITYGTPSATDLKTFDPFVLDEPNVLLS